MSRRTRRDRRVAGNFHGRTTTIVASPTDPDARGGFGPFTPGFRHVPYGDLAALEAAVDADTVAVLVEPIQGEAGVVIPPPATCSGSATLCTERSVLLIADEIQSGLGRTGTTFACDHEGVRPDVYILGKALAAASCPSRRSSADREVLRRDPARQPRLAPSAATRWPAPSAARSSAARGPGVPEASRRRSARTCWSGSAPGAPLDVVRERPRQGPVDRHRARPRGGAGP